ncbi:MAG: pseudouridine synthase [Bacteroidota bacterium]
MEILFQDEHIIAVNKPAGMLVHKTSLAADVRTGFVVQTLRDQIGQHVYPVHRLDRPTSGVLILGLSSESARLLKAQFDQRTVQKTYVCLVRGYAESEGVLTYPLTKENGSIQESETHFTLIRHLELPISNARFNNTRYSLLKVSPKTGRMHQIRRHFAKKRQYLLGDTKYGDLKSNRAFQDYTGLTGLMLHAKQLVLQHPTIGEMMKIEANSPDWLHKIEDISTSDRLQWSYPESN